MKVDEYRNQKVRYSAKGAAIKKAGFLSGIHSLPSNVKTRLDELLLHRYAPEKALSCLEAEFPEINLPSKSAIYTYKQKYLSIGLTASQLGIIEKLDIEKMNTASLLISHIRRFIAIDLNVLQDRWYKTLEAEKQGEYKKFATDAGKLYLDGIRTAMDLLAKLNVKMQVEEPEEGEATVADNRTEDEKREAAIYYSKYQYERRERGESMSETELSLARVFERRGKIDMHLVESRRQYKQEQAVQSSNHNG